MVTVIKTITAQRSLSHSLRWIARKFSVIYSSIWENWIRKLASLRRRVTSVANTTVYTQHQMVVNPMYTKWNTSVINVRYRACRNRSNKTTQNLVIRNYDVWMNNSHSLLTSLLCVCGSSPRSGGTKTTRPNTYAWVVICTEDHPSGRRNLSCATAFMSSSKVLPLLVF